MKEDDIFGELSLPAEKQHRSASVVAVTDCELIEIDGNKLKDFLEKNHELGFYFYKEIFFSIGKRIRKSNKRFLNLKLEVKETSSLKKAWGNVKDNIDNSIAVGLKLDCYYLEYFTEKIHFAGHYIAMYGYDDEFAYLVDAAGQDYKAKTSLKSLELARNEKGPMSSKNLSYTIQKKGVFGKLKMRVVAFYFRDFLDQRLLCVQFT